MSKPSYLTGESACNHNKLIAEMELLEMELNILLRTSSKTWSWEERKQGPIYEGAKPSLDQSETGMNGRGHYVAG